MESSEQIATIILDRNSTPGFLVFDPLKRVLHVQTEKRKNKLSTSVARIINIESREERSARRAKQRPTNEPTSGEQHPSDEELSNNSRAACCAPAAAKGPELLDVRFLYCFPKKVKDFSDAKFCTFGLLQGAEGEKANAIIQNVLQIVYPCGAKKITVFVSPKSGAGKAEKLWSAFTQPILRLSRHTVEAITTSRARQPEEWAVAAELGSNEIAAVVGGDGMVHELINGLFKRPSGFPPDLLVASVAAGSGCALSKTLGVLNPIEASLAMVHGTSTPYDLLSLSFLPNKRFVPLTDDEKKKKKKNPDSVVQRTLDTTPTPQANPSRVAFLDASFGVTNDIDKGSEVYRWMGNGRFTFYTLKSLVSGVPKYRCSVRYVPYFQPHEEKGLCHKIAPTDPVPTISRCTHDADCAYCKAHLNAPQPQGGGEDPWVSLDDSEFVLFMCCKTPFIAQDMLMAPFAHDADGAIDVVWVPYSKEVSRTAILKALIDIEEGKHVASPHLRYIKARAVEVLAHDGLVMSDGEVYEEHGVMISVVPTPIRFLRKTK